MWRSVDDMGRANKNKVTTCVRISRVEPMNPLTTYHGIQIDRGIKPGSLGGRFQFVDVEPGTGSLGAHFNDSEVVKIA